MFKYIQLLGIIAIYPGKLLHYPGWTIHSLISPLEHDRTALTFHRGYLWLICTSITNNKYLYIISMQLHRLLVDHNNKERKYLTNITYYKPVELRTTRLNILLLNKYLPAIWNLNAFFFANHFSINWPLTTIYNIFKFVKTFLLDVITK